MSEPSVEAYILESLQSVTTEKNELEFLIDQFNSKLPASFPEATPHKTILLEGFVQLVEHGKRLSSSAHALEMSKHANELSKLSSAKNNLESLISLFNSRLPSPFPQDTAFESILNDGIAQLVQHGREDCRVKLNLEIESLNAEVSQLLAANLRLMEESNTFSLLKEELVQQLSDRSAEFANDKSILDNQVSDLETKKAHAENHLAKLKEQLFVMKSEAESLKSDNEALAKDKDEAQHHLAKLKEQLFVMKSEAESSKSDNEALAKDKDEAQHHLAEFQKQLDASQLKSKNIRDQYESTLQQLHRAQEELEHLYFSDRSKQEHSKIIENEIGSVRATNDLFRRQLAELKRLLEVKGKDQQRTSTELQASTQQNQLGECQIADLILQLEEQKKKLDVKDGKLQKVYAEYNEKLALREQDIDLITLQLNQVQEELAYYFELNRKRSEMLTYSRKLNNRMSALFVEVTK